MACPREREIHFSLWTLHFRGTKIPSDLLLSFWVKRRICSSSWLCHFDTKWEILLCLLLYIFITPGLSQNLELKLKNMKKIFLFLFILIPLSTFAWGDIDSLCTGSYAPSPFVDSYLSHDDTWKDISVHYLWKTWGNPYDERDFDRLYYFVHVTSDVANVSGELRSEYTRSDLYMYNCETKTSTLYLKLHILKGYEPYRIGFASNEYIVISGASMGMMTAPNIIIGLDVEKKKRLFTLRWVEWNFKHGWGFDGFSSWKDGWYFIYTDGWERMNSIYKIDKKTKKIIKL